MLTSITPYLIVPIELGFIDGLFAGKLRRPQHTERENRTVLKLTFIMHILALSVIQYHFQGVEVNGEGKLEWCRFGGEQRV